MPDVRQTRLPGTGIRHDFETDDGVRLGVLIHYSGRRDLLIYRDDDPDACLATVELDSEDSAALVELLGGSQVSEAVGEALRQRVKGLTIDWIAVEEQSECAGKSIGAGALRTRTGASVVAVLRREETFPSPEPDFVLEIGDTVVAVGTEEGIRALSALLRV